MNVVQKLGFNQRFERLDRHMQRVGQGADEQFGRQRILGVCQLTVFFQGVFGAGFDLDMLVPKGLP